MSEYHQSYQSSLIHTPVTTSVSETPGVWTELDFVVPEDKDRYWLFIPHPGYDFWLSWDGGSTYTVHTDNYLTPVLQGIQRDEAVHFSVADAQEAPLSLSYFMLLPFFSRVLT